MAETQCNINESFFTTGQNFRTHKERVSFEKHKAMKLVKYFTDRFLNLNEFHFNMDTLISNT